VNAVDRISAALAATGLHRQLPASGPLLVMLHGLGGADGVTPALFEALLDRLVLRRRIVPFAEAVAALGKPEAAGLAALTFDDGYVDFADAALPILARRGLHATLFVPGGLLGATNAWDLGYAQERRILDAAVAVAVVTGATDGARTEPVLRASIENLVAVAAEGDRRNDRAALRSARP
jgi:peptidoglycan/xylan/chitin deacetylase (PgdA/CDA1 family)